jgi:hypothetical protein
MIPEARNDRSDEFGLTSTFLKINFYDTDFFLWSKIFDIGFTTKKIGVFFRLIFKNVVPDKMRLCNHFGPPVQSYTNCIEEKCAQPIRARNKTGKDRCVPIGAEIFKIVRDIKGRGFMLYFKKWSSLRFVAYSQKIVWHRTLSVTASILQILIKSDLIEWSNSSGRRFEE